MSTYTYTANFGNKDSLPSGSAGKIIKGADFDVEFNNIEAAINDTDSKATANETAITSLQASQVSNTGDDLSGIYKYADFSELRFGAGEDLRIFHNGVNSFVTDLGTGNLIISSNGAGVAIKTTDDAPMAEFINGGSCKLYHNGQVKVNTTATGVNIAGLSVDDAVTSLYGSTVAPENGGIFFRDKGFPVAENAHYLEIAHHANSFNTSYFTTFKFDGNVSGGISRSGATGVAYLTSSDYRLKENIEPVDNAADRVKALKPCRFNFIGEERIVDGFLAHEAQEIVPESVTGDKDAVDADGAPMYQGIDQSKLVPLLTAALQEALERIETLESVVSGGV